jgi:hypothetical protein
MFVLFFLHVPNLHFEQSKKHNGTETLSSVRE